MTAPRAGQAKTSGVLTISAGHAIHDSYGAFLPALLPVFISKLGLLKVEAGLLTVFVQGPSLLQPFIGYLADRVSLRYFVVLAPAITATMMSLLGVAPTYGLLIPLLIIAGISSAGLHAVGPVMAGHLAGSRLGRAMGFWMVGGELGRTLGPIMIVTAIQWLSLEGIPWLMLGGWIGSLVLYLRLRDVPGRPAETRQALPWRAALRAMAPLLVPLSGVIATRAFMLSAITTYLPTFLSEEGASLWLAGAALSLLEAAGMAGALLGGSISDRVGRRRVLFVSLLVTPLLMFTFVFAGGWLRGALLLPMGFAALAVTPAIMAMVQETHPENRALANGLYMALGFGLRSVAVVALGGLADLLGMRSAFMISAAIPLLGLPLVFLLPGRRR